MSAFRTVCHAILMAGSAILTAGKAFLMTGGAVQMAGLNVVFHRLMSFLSFCLLLLLYNIKEFCEEPKRSHPNDDLYADIYDWSSYTIDVYSMWVSVQRIISWNYIRKMCI
jgi:hypothetical protein